MKDYLSNLDYAERKAMKITSEALISLLMHGKAHLIDIRLRKRLMPGIWG